LPHLIQQPWALTGALGAAILTAMLGRKIAEINRYEK